MSNNKRYYWLKLNHDFFASKEMKKLRKIAGGDTYTIIYLKMQLASLKDNGILFFEGVEDTFEEELALDIDEDTENVRVTISFLMKYGLLKAINENEFSLPEAQNSIGSETAGAERARRYRNKNKALQNNAETLLCNKSVTVASRRDRDRDRVREYKDICATHVARSQLAQAQKSQVKEKESEKDSRSALENRFTEFWEMYPKHRDKQKALRAFTKIKPNDALQKRIIAAVKDQSESAEWQKEGGKYIPMPSTWLNGARWEDEVAGNVPDESRQADEVKKQQEIEEREQELAESYRRQVEGGV